MCGTVQPGGEAVEEGALGLRVTGGCLCAVVDDLAASGRHADTRRFGQVRAGNTALQAASGQRLIDDYKGLILRINWGPFGDFLRDSKELRIDFTPYYFLTKFFKDVQGLEALMDPKLLEVYKNLHHETS